MLPDVVAPAPYVPDEDDRRGAEYPHRRLTAAGPAPGSAPAQRGRAAPTFPRGPKEGTPRCEGSIGKLYRAPSRLYRNQILQENMHLKALAEISTMHSFAQLCNLNLLSKFANFLLNFERTQQIQQNF